MTAPPDPPERRVKMPIFTGEVWRTIRYALRSWGHTWRLIAIIAVLGVVVRLTTTDLALPWLTRR